MNEKGITIYQVIALIFVVFICLISFFVIKNFTSKDDTAYVKYEKSSNPNILLLGSYVEYVSMNGKYEEKGVVAYSKSGKNISNYVTTKIYTDDHIVVDIDTSKFKTYKITYTAVDPDDSSLSSTVSRILIVTDTTAPKISLPKTQIITSNDVLSYDLREGVIVSDNSGNVTVTNDNPLKNKPGKYIVTYKAKDSYGNTTIRKRLIKVIKGIEIYEKNNKIIIDVPDDEYTYKYSLDGGNIWINCTNITEIDLNNVIVAKFMNEEYISSVNYNV